MPKTKAKPTLKIGKKIKARNFLYIGDNAQQKSIPYVLSEDVKAGHPQKFVEAFDKWMNGQTGMIVPANDESHKKKEDQLAIYYWDYERFYNSVVHGKATYWD